MKKIKAFFSVIFVFMLIGTSSLLAQCTDLYIEGVIDGPLSGGKPKAMQLCATANIPDLSIYGIESVTNASSSTGSPEFTLPADALSTGDCIWITAHDAEFTSFFGFPACYIEAQINSNGDDDYLLYCNGALSDVYGVDAESGTGFAWDYMDGWANRNGTTPNPIFTSTEWTYSGINALDGETTNAMAATPYPNTTVNCVVVPDIILISEVELCTKTIELENIGTTTVDISTWRLCSRPIYHDVVSANVTIVSGSPVLAPGDFIVLNWPSINNTGAGEIGLYLPTGGFNDQLSIVDYVVYNGIPAQNRASVAVSAGVWDDATLSATIDGAAGCNSAIANGTNPMMTNSLSWCPADMTTLTTPFTNSACGSNLMCPLAGDLVITEIMQNPTTSSDGDEEYFEVYNMTGSAIDMMGYSIYDLGSNSFVITSSVLVPAGGYVVFAENGDMATNGGIVVDYIYPTAFTLGNGDDEIIIDCNGTIIDEVQWDGGPAFPDPTGASMNLNPTLLDATSNDTGANWCESSLNALTTGDFGTPGAANETCAASTCMIEIDFFGNTQCLNGDFIFDVNFTATAASGSYEVLEAVSLSVLATGSSSPISVTLPANTSSSSLDVIVRDQADNSCVSAIESIQLVDCSAIVCAGVGDLVISEILFDPNPPEDSGDEFFEVYNPTASSIDMLGYSIKDNGSNFFFIDMSVVVPAGGYVIFGENADMTTNGGVMVDFEYPTIHSLSNTSDEIIIQCGGITIDEVMYDFSMGWPGTGNGVSISLDPNSLDAVSNDDPVNWCDATISMTGSFVASLGAANDVCTTPCPDDYANGGMTNSQAPLTGLQDVDADYEAAGDIISDQVIGSIDPTIMVDYDSGTSILMDSGFEVFLDVTFHAFIDGCGGAQ